MKDILPYRKAICEMLRLLMLSFSLVGLAPASTNSAHAAEVTDPRVFNCGDYLHYNPALRSFSCYQAITHWTTTGIREGRRASVTFFSREYLQLYPDLLNAFGTSGYLAAIDHYLTHGIAEGRSGATLLHPDVFDVQYYYFKNPDLRPYSPQFATRHWILNGIREGRQAAPTFFSRDYLSIYADLRAAFGTNYEAATYHYVNGGIAERRAGIFSQQRPASILKYPIIGNPLSLPSRKVGVGLFGQSEAGVCPPGDTLCAFSSVDDTFAGDIGTLGGDSYRAIFREAISKYMPWHGIVGHPACAPPAASPDVEISTFGMPYEYSQTEFLNYISSYSSGRIGDFLPSKVRNTASWQNQRCPVDEAGYIEDPVGRFGQAVHLNGPTLMLVQDNLYYPLRWIAPGNCGVVQGHEQPSIAFDMYPKDAPSGRPTIYDQVNSILSNAMSDRSKRIMLEYDVDLDVKDYRGLLWEYSLWDVVGWPIVGWPWGVTDLYGKTLRNLIAFLQAYPSRKDVEEYLITRFIEPTIQVSVQFNFKQRADSTSPSPGAYRLTEFMIAGKNYRRSWVAAFKPTANDTINQYIPEGGNSGGNGQGPAVTRLQINALTLQDFRQSNPSLVPVRYGGEYYEIPDGGGRRRLRGLIDITDYYLLARGHRFFPGSGGSWNDIPAIPDPSNMSLGLEWAGVIFEVHGPFRVELDVHKFDVYVEGK